MTTIPLTAILNGGALLCIAAAAARLYTLSRQAARRSDLNQLSEQLDRLEEAMHRRTGPGVWSQRIENGAAPPRAHEYSMATDALESADTGVDLAGDSAPATAGTQRNEIRPRLAAVLASFAIAELARRGILRLAPETSLELHRWVHHMFELLLLGGYSVLHPLLSTCSTKEPRPVQQQHS